MLNLLQSLYLLQTLPTPLLTILGRPNSPSKLKLLQSPLSFADSPYYSPDCEYCVGGPNSPSISGCSSSVVTDTPYCGLQDNPCTQNNIMLGHMFFACPVNESQYLQCNNWGHAFVQQCREIVESLVDNRNRQIIMRIFAMVIVCVNHGI